MPVEGHESKSSWTTPNVFHKCKINPANKRGHGLKWGGGERIVLGGVGFEGGYDQNAQYEIL